MLDIHSHILPGVDDGPESIEASIEVLKRMKEQAITHVIATPHFNAARQDIDEHKKNVLSSYKQLISACKGIDVPNISIGCEVMYFLGMGKSSGIRELTLCDSKYLLVEFPFCDLASEMISDIKEIGDRSGIIPIIAHIERYSSFRNFKKLLRLVSDGHAYAQVNATSLCNSLHKKQALKLIKKGYISFLATDSHAIDVRPPVLNEAIDVIKNELGEQYSDSLINNSKAFCEEIFKPVEDIYAE